MRCQILISQTARLTLTFITAMLFLAGSNADATVLTFDDAVTRGDSVANFSVSEGFTFSEAFVTSGSQLNQVPGEGNYLSSGYHGRDGSGGAGILVIPPAPFTLNSFDLSQLYSVISPNLTIKNATLVIVTGFQNNIATLQMSLTPNTSFTTYTPSGWTDLTNVSFHGFGSELFPGYLLPGYFAIDNLNMDLATPEPSTAGLMGFPALLALLVYRRRLTCSKRRINNDPS